MKLVKNMCDCNVAMAMSVLSTAPPPMLMPANDARFCEMDDACGEEELSFGARSVVPWYILGNERA